MKKQNHKKVINITPTNIRGESLFSELYGYRNLVLAFIYREFVSFYKQTLFGPLWIIIFPFLNSLVFFFLFNKVAGINTGSAPPLLFYFLSFIIWNLFSSSVQINSSYFNYLKPFFEKVYFSRISYPIAINIINLIKFFIQLGIFFIFYIYFYFNGYNLYLNIIIVFQLFLILCYIFIFSLGVSLILNSLTFKYRDFTHLTAFGLNLWMFLTPVVYPLSEAPEKYKIFILLNPMSSILEFSRYSFFDYGNLDFYYFLYSIIIGLIVFFIGILLFIRTERNFIDVI